MIKYVTDKYGEANVAQIITFNRMTSKAVLKDVGRVLGVDFGDQNRIAKMIPVARGKPAKLKVMISDNTPEPAFKQAYENEIIPVYNDNKEEVGSVAIRNWVDMAIRIEGTNKTFGVHAAGVVISSQPLDEIVPLQRNNDGSVITQYYMEDVEAMGLLKMDFLGLKNLTTIQRAAGLVQKTKGVTLDLDQIPLDEKKALEIIAKGKQKKLPADIQETHKLFRAGNLEGIFQLESDGMKQITRDLKPSGIEDLSSISALYRPGPLDAGLIPIFIDRKHGREKVSYQHPPARNNPQRNLWRNCLPRANYENCSRVSRLFFRRSRLASQGNGEKESSRDGKTSRKIHRWFGKKRSSPSRCRRFIRADDQVCRILPQLRY